jgi:thiol-disulfide isomerase/thioredoxin
MQLHSGKILALTTAFVCLLLSSPPRAQEAGDLAAFRKMHAELRQQMDQGLEQATEYLEAKIAATPDSADLNVLRESLAARMIQEGDYQAATIQFERLLDFQIKHVGQSENLFGVLMTVQSMQRMARQSGGSSEFRRAVDRAFEALAAVDNPVALMPVSQLVVLKAQHLVGDGKEDEAKPLVTAVLKRLTKVNDSDQGSEETMQALVRMLTSLTTTERANDAWRDQYEPELLRVAAAAIDKYPRSPVLQTAYADTQYMMITTWGQDDPEATNKRMAEVTAKLLAFAANNRSVAATLRRIELHKDRLAAAKPVATLVGKPAPPWDIDAWINAGDTTRDSLQGKIVLLDFWAIWCGPCIATFPHLRQWREEFAEQGFEIVGVTQYYNYVWDDLNQRATRAEDDVDPQEERAMLEKFLEHHQLMHPVIVTPAESKMASEFGVRGIPHVVLLDGDGVVQLVKTGAGKATADEIHAKIKELIEARKPN